MNKTNSQYILTDREQIQLTRSKQLHDFRLECLWPFINQCLMCLQCSQLPQFQWLNINSKWFQSSVCSLLCTYKRYHALMK